MDQATSASTEAEIHLQTALASCREIGAAVGILMERHALTYDNAWEKLRRASQNTNTPVRDLASDLVHTGHLDEGRRSGRSTGETPRSLDCRSMSHVR